MEGHWTILITYFLAVVVEIGLPVTLAVLIIKKWKVSWLVVLTGVLTFIGSQVVHLPILSLPALLQKFGLNITLPQYWPIGLYALYLGILAGLCEETARWVGYKLLKSKAASYKSAFGLGIGHGGVESVIVGVLVLTNVLAFVLTTPEAMQAGGASVEATRAYAAQSEQFWAIPWHLPLAGAVERVTAVSAHLLMSVMVWKAVKQRSWLWYLLAVGYHALLDWAASYMSLMGTFSNWEIEAALLPLLVVSVVGLFLFWRKEKASAETAEIKDPGTPTLPA